MAYFELSEAARRQLAASARVHRETIRCEALKMRYRHELRWVESAGETRLHRVDPVSSATVFDFGAQDAQLIELHQRYSEQRAGSVAAAAAAEHDSKRTAVLNREHGIARVPDVVIKVLNVLARHNLSSQYLVIGTHALFAYEVEAGISFEADALTTSDVDLLWDVQQRIRLLHTLHKREVSMVKLLQEADPTFERNEEDKASAINNDSFSVDFLRRKECQDYSDAFSMSEYEGDVYPVQAPRSQQFLNSPRYEQVVIGHSGQMALMRTVEPSVFVDFKNWMSGRKDREAMKRSRDRRQAMAVQQLLDEGRLAAR